MTNIKEIETVTNKATGQGSRYTHYIEGEDYVSVEVLTKDGRWIPNHSTTTPGANAEINEYLQEGYDWKVEAV